MERILLYVHFNKYKRVSNHVFYQLEQLKPLFSKIIFIFHSKRHVFSFISEVLHMQVLLLNLHLHILLLEFFFVLLFLQVLIFHILHHL